MRKSFATYVIIWAIAFALFNIAVFAIPSSINGETIINVVKTVTAIKGGTVNQLDIRLVQLADCLMNSGEKELILDKFGGAFWPGYIVIVVAFIGQLICASYVFKEKNNQKFFYKVSLLTTSYTGLIVTLIIGLLCMFIPNVPVWVGAVVAIVVLAFIAISLLKANLAVEIVSNIDDKVEEKTSFIKEMTAKAKTLYDANKDNELLKKLYEEFRYANPISCIETSYIEKDIMDNFVELNNSIDDNKIDEIVKLLKERNEIVKALKK